MIPVSDEYKQAIKDEIRNFDIKSIILRERQPIPVSRLTETTGRIDLGSLDTVFNELPFTYKYARLEQDYMQLDGSFILPNRSNNEYMEFLGNGTNCSLTFYFSPGKNSYSNKKMKILFDGGYATSFTVDSYLGDYLMTTYRLVEEKTYTNDKEAIVIDIPTLGNSQNSKKITITINSWSNNQLPKIKKIMSNENMILDSDDIVDMKMLEQTDLRGLDVPAGDFSITLDNYNRQYNILDPNNILNQLKKDDSIITYLGLSINGAYEYVPVGGYRYSNYRENSNKTIELNFDSAVARNLTHNPLLYDSPETPAEVAYYLFEDRYDDRTDYIDYTGNLPAQYYTYSSRQEQQQEALLFYNMSVKERRVDDEQFYSYYSGIKYNGVRLFNIDSLNQGVENYTISLNEQIKNPEFNKATKTKKVRFNYYTFSSTTSGKVEIYNGKIKFSSTTQGYSGTVDIYAPTPIPTGAISGDLDVYYNDTKIIDDGTIDTTAGFGNSYSYYQGGYYYFYLHLYPQTYDKTTGTFRVEVPTYEKLDNTYEVENPNVSEGATIEINTDILKTATDMDRISQTIFDYEDTYPYEFNVEIMGDIRLEVGDKITLESLDGYHTAIIQSIDTTYNGGLTQIIKGVSTGVLQ